MFRFLSVLLSLQLMSAHMSRADVLELFLDADFSTSAASAQSIELGFRTALDEVDNRLGGLPVTLVPYDNRGNVKRSHRTMKRYLDSDRALALIGGLHSPPYLTHRSFINENRVLTLLTWSAAGPVTRAAEGQENWIFRLSVDDTKSGEFFVREALDQSGCQNFALVLLDTGWGRANLTTLSAAMERRGTQAQMVAFFPTTLGKAAAGTLAEQIADSGADCAVLLATPQSAVIILRALDRLNAPLRIFSHWGIMGGPFHENIGQDILDRFDFKVLQTCGLRRARKGSMVLERALKAAPGAPASLSDLAAPTGFVHGYDMARLVIRAADAAAATQQWQGDILEKRAALRNALRDLERPVPGILKTYQTPFGRYAPDNPDAHEALGLDDLCLARFVADGHLVDAQ